MFLNVLLQVQTKRFIYCTLKLKLTTNFLFLFLSEQVTTVAGSTQGYKDGFGTDAHFQHVAGILLDPDLEMLYIADSVSFYVVKILLFYSFVYAVI